MPATWVDFGLFQSFSECFHINITNFKGSDTKNEPNSEVMWYFNAIPEHRPDCRDENCADPLFYCSYMKEEHLTFYNWEDHYDSLISKNGFND